MLLAPCIATAPVNFQREQESFSSETSIMSMLEHWSGDGYSEGCIGRGYRGGAFDRAGADLVHSAPQTSPAVVNVAKYPIPQPLESNHPIVFSLN
ncbi:hypothetical protein PCASD_17743 [Puccinia coronata f. sp. avenae]|nr:hypothetical protein PCASD_17743 [Puccinia coronata f. sp. avenae]